MSKSPVSSPTTQSNEDQYESAIPLTLTETSETTEYSCETAQMSIRCEDALRDYSHRLTEYEKEEIKQFPTVYFLGRQLKDKTVADERLPNYGFDDEDKYYSVLIGAHIAYRYEIRSVLGKGSFAKCISAIDHKYGQHMAIKIMRHIPEGKHTQEYNLLFEREVSILKYLTKQDVKNENHCVRLLDDFVFRNHRCLVFEALDMSLLDLCKRCSYKGLHVGLVQRFAQHMLMCLNVLYTNGIIHADLKPENILLKDKRRTNIKVIDFGWSSFLGDEQLTSYFQSRYYRAPEVILNGPYTTAVDIWSLGCILVELYLGYPIFQGVDRHDQLAAIMEVLGQPPASFLSRCKYTNLYFTANMMPKYCRVITQPDRYILLGRQQKQGHYRGPPGSQPLHLMIDDAENLLVRCFQWNPEKRTIPPEAWRHRFIRRASQMCQILPPDS